MRVDLADRFRGDAAWVGFAFGYLKRQFGSDFDAAIEAYKLIAHDKIDIRLAVAAANIAGEDR